MLEQVGSYRLLAEVESAGLSQIFDASDASGERALKVQRIRLPEDVRDDMIPRFEREVALAATLDHPSIVRILDHGVEAGCPYVVLEALDAIPLEQLRRRAGGRLDPLDAATVVYDVARGLEHAHAHRPPVLHRGLSPHVILIDAAGHARIGGYAVTALLAAMSAVYSQVLELTCHYQSPELLKGADLTAASDMFSLGATLYELLAGRPAFDGPTPLAATLKINMGAFDRLELAAPDVPSDLRDLVHALLSSQPAARPTATDLIGELGAFVGRPDERRHGLGEIVRPAPPAPAPVVSTAIAIEQDEDTGQYDDRTDRNLLHSGMTFPPIAAPAPPVMLDPIDDAPTKEVALPEPHPVAPTRATLPDLPHFSDVPEDRTSVDGAGEVEKTVLLKAPRQEDLMAPAAPPTPEDPSWLEKTVQIVTPAAGSTRLDRSERATVPPSLPRRTLPDVPPPPAPIPEAEPLPAPAPAEGPSVGLFVALGAGAIGVVVLVAAITAWLASG